MNNSSVRCFIKIFFHHILPLIFSMEQKADSEAQKPATPSRHAGRAQSAAPPRGKRGDRARTDLICWPSLVGPPRPGNCPWAPAQIWRPRDPAPPARPDAPTWGPAQGPGDPRPVPLQPEQDTLRGPGELPGPARPGLPTLSSSAPLQPPRPLSLCNACLKSDWVTLRGGGA